MSVKVTTLPAYRVAYMRHVGPYGAHGIPGLWEWLPASGYQPDDRPCLEIYRGDPNVAGRAGTFRCELCVPIRPLSRSGRSRRTR